jgi:hypothetical protein
MIYLTGSGRYDADDFVLRLVAPTGLTGPDAKYNGVALFQDPTDHQRFHIDNNMDLTLTGAIYLPGAFFDVNNNLTARLIGCSSIVARSLHVDNNGTVTATGCSGGGGGAGSRPSIAE